MTVRERDARAGKHDITALRQNSPRRRERTRKSGPFRSARPMANVGASRSSTTMRYRVTWCSFSRRSSSAAVKYFPRTKLAGAASGCKGRKIGHSVLQVERSARPSDRIHPQIRALPFDRAGADRRRGRTRLVAPRHNAGALAVLPICLETQGRNRCNRADARAHGQAVAVNLRADLNQDVTIAAALERASRPSTCSGRSRIRDAANSPGRRGAMIATDQRSGHDQGRARCRRRLR